jgi:UDP:flavonoid glycosyltransferase YjiC (YdhE family)
MADILFVTWDGGGNVPPAVEVGTQLRDRGHTVRFLGHARLADRFTQAGLRFSAFEQARRFDSTVSNSPVEMIAMFGDRAMGRDVLDELERAPADVVVVDCLLLGVMDVIAEGGQEYVALEHLYDEYLMKSWLRGPIGLGLRAKRIHSLRLLDQAQIRLVACSRELDPGADKALERTNVVYTGPAVTGAPADPVEPTVLVSLSTFNFAGQAKALQNILTALEGLPVRAIVTTGPSIDAGDLVVPANAELHRWLPHAEVMPQVSLVIGHGGHATTMQALGHDLPLIVMPMHPLLDQPMVGKSVEQAGAGRLLKKKSSPATIRAAIEEQLSDPRFRVGAARLGADIRESRGATTAADRVLSLVRNGAARP